MILKLKKFIVKSDYKVRNLILKLFSKLFFRTIKNKSGIKKIIIFRTGSIGDNICAFPAIYSIKKNFPSAKIDILTNAGATNNVSIEKLINPNLIDQTINYINKDKKQLFKELRKENYDLFIELPQYDAPLLRLIRNQIVVKLLKIPYAFGWQIGITFLFPKFQEKYIEFQRETPRLLNILKSNNIETYNDIYDFHITNTQKENVSKTLEHLSEKKQKNIGFIIGGKFKRNHWAVENFQKVAEYFSKKEYNILIFGGNGDIEKAKIIEEVENVYSFCGKLQPLESLEALKHCSVVLSNDTGPMHMTYSVGTPLVAIFSCREYPNKWFPPENKKNIVLRSTNIPCSICAYKTCIDNFCVQKITTEQVISCIESLIQKFS